MSTISTVGSEFARVNTGRFINVTSVLGGPQNTLSIKGGSKTRSKKVVFAVSQNKEFEETLGDGTKVMRPVLVQIVVTTAAQGVTASQIRDVVAGTALVLNDATNGDYLESILMGSSDPVKSVSL